MSQKYWKTQKASEKEAIFLNSYFGCPFSFNKAKSDSKTKKTFFSSMLRLLKYKTVEENWRKKSLAPFNARNWLQYNKDICNFSLLKSVCTIQRSH